MKKTILLIALCLTYQLQAQKFFTKSGEVGFEASVPSFEEVKAKNNKATAIINTKTGDVAALVLIKGFRFKIALMEEHFNENYAESDKFPKAKFTGVIKDYTESILNKKSTVTLKGKLTFHGVTNEIEFPAELKNNGTSINLSGKFSVKSSDYKIEIPSLIKKKVAETVDVTINFNLNPR